MGLLLIFLCSSIRQMSFSFITSRILLFALLIENPGGISSVSCSTYFEYFLTTVVSHFIYPPCLRKKCDKSVLSVIIMLYCLNSEVTISCSLVLFSHIKGSLIINVHLSSKIILVDPNFVLTFFGNNFFVSCYGAPPWK